MNLYDKLRPGEGRRRREWPVWIAAAVLMLAVLLPIVHAVASYLELRTQHRSFLGELSSATIHAYATVGVRVEDGEETFTLTGEDVYIPYNALANAGPGPLGEELPAGGDTLRFDYGKGIVLQVWTVPMTGAALREEGLFVHFSGLRGARFDYTTDRFTVEDLRILCRSAAGG